MSDKKCPQCDLWNSGNAELCDCGYNFITGNSEEYVLMKKKRITSFIIIFISCLFLCNDYFDWFSWTAENSINEYSVTSNSLGYGKYDHGDYPKQITYNYSNNDIIMLDLVFMIRTISMIIALLLLIVYFVKLQVKEKAMIGVIVFTITLCMVLPVILNIVEARYIEDIHETYTLVNLRSDSLHLSGIILLGPTIYILGIILLTIDIILFPPIKIRRANSPNQRLEPT